jgi:inosine-uridine nucleoside N-ribohydrolase
MVRSTDKTSCRRPAPVVLDTDIGTDIDDTWALVMLLNSPELDVRLITTSIGDTTYRAKIVARMLEIAGRTDIPIGIGPKAVTRLARRQEQWVADYDLSRYPGTVYDDGVEAMTSTVLDARDPITLVSIGPLTTVAAALDRRPEIANKARFVGMHGSIAQGHDNSDGPTAEFNVAHDRAASAKVFAAPWPMTITPLDTCSFVRLAGEDYQRILLSGNPLVQALAENNRLWAQRAGREDELAGRSSVLYDTVAVYLAMAEDLLEIREMGIRITDHGVTAVDDSAKKVRCAVAWKDYAAFQRLLVERIDDPARQVRGHHELSAV